MPWADKKDKQATVKRGSAGVTFKDPPPQDKVGMRDVDKDDLMAVIRGGKDENLPQMVREYILHDRGNSLFLGDSFGNLPSPVGESPTIKKLFKFNEDEPLDKKRKNESKNQAIRIEGKKDKEEKEEKPKHSPERQP